MKKVILTIKMYRDFFYFQKPNTGCNIEKEDNTCENYFAFFTYLPVSFFNIDNPILSSFISNSYSEIWMRFELFGISDDEYDEYFIFKPWVIEIDNPVIYNAIENFHLYIPSRLFYDLLLSQLFMELFSVNQMKQIRILKDIPLVNISKNGLDRKHVPLHIASKRISMQRVSEFPIEAICDFYKTNWQGIDNMKTIYFNSNLNIWFKIVLLEANRCIGYFRLYSKSTIRDGSMAIEYIIAKNYRNNGYAVEALSLVKEYVSRYSYLSLLTAQVDESNEPSINLLRKENFEYHTPDSIMMTNYFYKLDAEIELYSKKHNPDEITFKTKYFNEFRRYWR